MKDPVLCVIGTRPEAVKMAPVIHELSQRGIPRIVLSTGQHRDLVRATLNDFAIDIDVDLDVMTHGQSPTGVASEVLRSLEPVLAEVMPSVMIVQGDTTTVMAAAIAGAYARVRVAHLEAGLRTGDRRQPFPEELNRIIAASVADLHFAPTATARANLLAEGIDPLSIVVTGNTVIDALYWARDLLEDRHVPDRLRTLEPDRKLLLVTAHRRESFGAPLERLLGAVARVAQTRDDVAVLLPVHPNPNVREPVQRILGGIDAVHLTGPLDYFGMVAAMDRAHVVLTDSGGIQEEAPAFGIPVLVTRETTERPEAIEAGVAELVGTDAERILDRISAYLDTAAPPRGTKPPSPYGDGYAARRVVATLLGEPVPFFEPTAATLTGCLTSPQRRDDDSRVGG